jgi:NADPH:quinone reductase-like Zn-dependent oxidoreductase
MFQRIEFGSILGSDSVGRIVELNGESSRLQVGDRVLIMPSSGWISNPRGPEVEGNYAIRGGSKSQGKNFITDLSTSARFRVPVSFLA